MIEGLIGYRAVDRFRVIHEAETNESHRLYRCKVRYLPS
jgi:hypothetical protein